MIPPWQACVEEAWASYCAGSLPIGAVITGAGGQIVAKGRNCLFEQKAESPYLNGRLAHAEMNAIRAFELTGEIPTESKVYTTLEPCPMCLGAIRVNRFKAIHFAAHDAFGGSIGLLEANAFMRKEAPQIVGPSNTIFEALLLALYAETSLRLKLSRAMDQLPLRAQSCPIGIELGRKLHETCELAELQDQGATATVMFDLIAAKL